MKKATSKKQIRTAQDEDLNDFDYAIEGEFDSIDLVPHEATSIFPEMGPADFVALKDDIRKNGLRLPILVYRNKIIDGRYRMKACKEVGVAPRFQAVGDVGKSVEQYIISLNLRRRHLSESQRALVATRLAVLCKGANQHTAQAVGQKRAAALLNVSVDSIQRARQVQQRGVLALVQAVESGGLDVSNACALASLDPDEQAEVLKLHSKEILSMARDIRKTAMEERRKGRIAAIELKRSNNKPLVAENGSFSVIYADPPWDYISEEALGYPTMSVDDIRNLPVDQIAAKDAVLFLWCSASLIESALEVVKSWGFNYKTHAVWDKQKAGQGAYFRMRHELLFVATRGVVPEVPFSARGESVIQEWSTKPSEKPFRVRRAIEAMYPELPKLELFCRGEPAVGWNGWGNECVERLVDQPVDEVLDVAIRLAEGNSVVPNSESATNDEKILIAA